MIYQYKNGNTQVSLYKDGTRTLEFDSKIKLNFPLNIDIRVSTKCSFGQKPDGSFVLCSFCHEEAKTDGFNCDYNLLKDKLTGLPKGIELAIGCNEFTVELYDFLVWARKQDYVCNLTVNQGHISRDYLLLQTAIQEQLVYGVGISYRSSLPFKIPSQLLQYDHLVIHCIAGIDTVEDILSLRKHDIRNILILGEKDFGFNKGLVNKQDLNPWIWNLGLLINTFDKVSFDNLALEQLSVKRLFLNEDEFNTFNQGEESIYIDAPNKIFALSSRSFYRKNWDLMTLKEFYLKSRKIKEL